MLVVLEGGYDLNALAVSSEAVIQTMLIHHENEEELKTLL